MVDIETQLRQYATELDRLYPDAAVAVHNRATPTPLTSPWWRRGPARAALIAAAVLLVLGGTSLLVSRLSDAPPVVTTPETLPDDTPEVEVGGSVMVETSLGTWVWTRVSTSEAQTEFITAGSYRDFGWIESVSMPEPPLPEIDGIVWPPFETVVGSPWGPQLETGSDGNILFTTGWQATYGGVTIATASIFGEVDWNRLYQPQEGGWVTGSWSDLRCHLAYNCSVTTATLEVIAQPSQRILDALEVTIVSSEPAAVEYRDADTSELVLRIEATDPEVSAEELLLASADGGMRLSKLHVQGQGWVTPPWADLPDPVLWASTAANDDGFVLAAVVGYWEETFTLHSWTSTDGLNWEALEDQPIGDGLWWCCYVEAWIDGRTLLFQPHAGVLDPRSGRTKVPLVLELEGSRWIQNADFASFADDHPAVGNLWNSTVFHDILRIPWGWAATISRPSERSGCELWVSADGIAWELVPGPDAVPYVWPQDCEWHSTLDGAIGLEHRPPSSPGFNVTRWLGEPGA